MARAVRVAPGLVGTPTGVTFALTMGITAPHEFPAP